MRTIYVRPDELVKVRIVPEGYDKTFGDWEMTNTRAEMLVQFRNSHIQFSDPAIMVTRVSPLGGGQVPYNPTPERNR